MEREIILIATLFFAWFADSIFGDPKWIPHPIVLFGKCISMFDKLLNRGKHRVVKGGAASILLITLTWLITHIITSLPSPIGEISGGVLMFFFLAGKSLEREVHKCNQACSDSLIKGREQLSRIVGRDTSQLSANEIKKGALETLSENLSDGVIAPMFWFLIFGVPGAAAYKMINTLDSMIGYKNHKYLRFGRVAAKIDDIANYFPARITALLMIIASSGRGSLKFVKKYCHSHSSPNSGYPESALASALDCRFGGDAIYFGKRVSKPYIGDNQRDFNDSDFLFAIQINRLSAVMMVLIITIILLLKLCLRLYL